MKIREPFIDGANEIYKKDLLEKLYKLVNTKLTDRERTVIEEHFFKKVPIKEFQERFGVTAQTVSGIKRRALRKLKWELDFNEQYREIRENYQEINL